MNEVFLWGLLFLFPVLLLIGWLIVRRKHAQVLETALYEESVDENQIIAETTTASQKPTSTSKSEKTNDDLIIHLIIKSLENKKFSGTDIMLLMDDLSLEYGEMQLFHHYGLDDNPQQTPVFSIANMLEPGYFDVNDMLDFNTTGLIVFMRLPNIIDGRVAFELMLNHAQNISQKLHGCLQNSQGQSLETPQVALLRDQISQYEQKNTDI